jgi:hypothetical protein
VHGADGAVAVVTVEQIPRASCRGTRIWNDTTDPVLRLFTCGGEFDRSARSYRSSSNRVRGLSEALARDDDELHVADSNRKITEPSGPFPQF